jgi:hypothetical protein
MVLAVQDAAMLARIGGAPAAGDEVCFGTGRRYVIGVVYTEARGVRPYLLLRINGGGGTPGVVCWFEVVGRCDAKDIRIVRRGAFADRVAYWRERYPW